ncbi:bifunctional 2-polyprenyl-6-hydroxyphenol methylase/3-demethylubiquinol 3-O-methyltransferase UbiG [Gordonia sp. OPL2]|uniref:class I SAM-dependent methyltransferase n=1 Tax=Gordonia sp. OPL2 TaxID=2486274 RepID=UPI0016554F04|nr:class I SAM-dependent methyltransferase [Gordonia sp. OPL2]RPA06089.1 class I SAM-dependent methyltransferase [Gordonia sp. OPL2]
MSEHTPDDHSAAEWDERYRSADRLWTADVNPALVAEVSDLPAGTALDVGSGEGADARWLADQGWQVTAVDISQVAIDRAREADTREAITWLRADLSADEVPGRDFGLVSLQYFPIARTDDATVRRLLDAVGADGHLLVVSHEAEGVRAHGRNPDDYFQPADVAALLDDGWTVITDDTRERGVAAGGGAHTHDVVLHARKTRS